MEIIYVLTCLWLLVTTMLIKKSEQKQNFLLRMVLSVILFTVYNTLLSFVFLLFNITYNLVILSITNILISGFTTYLLYRKKEIQKYFIKQSDIIYMTILLFLVFIIALHLYTTDFIIKYETTDPAVHFLSAKEFYENKSLEWGGMMPGAFVNTAILFDVFDIIIPEENFYVLYIMFDLIMLYLIGAILYLGIADKIESIKKKVIVMIFSIIFLLGYPLNSMIFGFAYLSLAILYMTTLISLSIYMKNNEIKLLPLCVEKFLILFGIFFSYYFFVPVVYSAFGLYILFDIIKHKEKGNINSIITKENIIKVVTILILPTVMGFVYFVIPPLIKTGETMISHITTEGYIYRNLYSNFVLLAPLTIYYILNNLKNKRNSLSTIMFIICTIFTVVLLIGGLNGHVSSYYYYKIYFLLWILAVYINIKSMLMLIDKKEEILAYSFTGIFLVLLLIAYTGCDLIFAEENKLFNPKSNISSFLDVYVFNFEKIYSEKCTYSKTQIEAIKYILDISEDKSNILVNGKVPQMLWAESVWNLTDAENLNDLVNEEKLDLDKWLKNEQKKYLICFDLSQGIQRYTDEYRTIYQEKDVVILEKK